MLLIAPLVGVRMLAAQHTGAPPGGRHQGGQHQGGQHRGDNRGQPAGARPALRTAADTAAACRRPGAEQRAKSRAWLARQRGDTAFAAMQQRGQRVMGVNQYTSSHRFDELPDGGRIELQRDGDDAAEIAQIRRHFAEIGSNFADADFDAPGWVHAQDVPGTRVMAPSGRSSRIRWKSCREGRRCGSRVRTPRRSRRFTSSCNSSGKSTGRDSGRSGPNRDHGLGTRVLKHAASHGRP